MSAGVIGVRSLFDVERRSSRFFRVGIAFAALGALLWPVTRTWYLGDDAYVAFYLDAVALNGESRFDYLLDETVRGVERLGRFAPLGLAVHAAYALTPSVFAFKLGVVAVTLAATVLAAGLLRELGFGWPYLALYPVLMCTFLQLRYWHDPILAYGAGMPILACLVLASAMAFVRAQRRRSRSLHVAAVAVFVAACLFWEGAPFLGIAFVPLAWAVESPSVSRAIRRTAPFALIALCFVVLILGLRAAAPEQGETVNLYQPNLAPRSIAAGFSKQLSGGLPLSYLAAVARAADDALGLPPERSTTPYGAASAGLPVPSGFVDSETEMVVDGLARPEGVVLIALVMLALALALPHAARSGVTPRSILVALFFGAAFAVGAALPLAVSARWQAETFWGVSYIPVFLQYIGGAIAATALLALAFRVAARNARAPRVVSISAAAAVLAVVAITNSLNLRVVDAFEGVKVVMSFNGDAARAGLLESAAPAQELLLDDTAPVNPWFLTVERSAPVPPTLSLATSAERYAACAATPAYCPPSLRRIAYMSRLDPTGAPWAAVCTVVAEVSRRVGAPACAGEVVVATKPRDRGRACAELALDAAPAAGGTPQPGVALRRLRSAEDVVLCSGRLRAPVLVSSIAVGAQRTLAEGPLSITATHPEETSAGTPFNVQPNGQSAIAVEAVGATPTTRVSINGIEVPTRFVTQHLVTALVSAVFFEKPGQLEVRLRDRGVSSPPHFVEVTR